MAMSTRSRTGARPAPPPASAPARPTITKKRSARATPSSSQPSAAASADVDKSTSQNLLPDVTLLCDDGKQRNVRTLLTDATPGLILFTYPRANTTGCTAQASGLSALADQAATQGYSIAGCSYDTVKNQAAWKTKLALKCLLFSDTLDTGLLKKLGAHKAPKSVKRSVFIIRGGPASDKPDLIRTGDSTAAPNDQPVIIESRITISPKDCITFVGEYIRDHSAKETLAKPSVSSSPAVPSKAKGNSNKNTKPEPKEDLPGGGAVKVDISVEEGEASAIKDRDGDAKDGADILKEKDGMDD